MVFTTLLNHTYILNNDELNNSVKIESEDDIDIKMLSDAARDNNVILFNKSTKTEKTIDDVYYTSSDSISTLPKKLGIEAGKVRSFILSDINVSYKTFDQLEIGNYLECSVYGDKENIKQYVRKLKSLDGYSIVYDNRNSDNKKYLPFLLCIVLVAVTLLGSYFNAIYQKKEITIRIIHGESGIKYIMLNIITDTVVYLAVYFIIFSLFRRYTVFISVYNNLIWVYLALCVLNCLAYFPLFKFNSREVIYGYQHTRKITSALFTVKTISTLTVAVIIGAVCLIMPELGNFYKSKKFFETHKDYTALEFRLAGIKDPTENNNWEYQQEQMLKRRNSENALVNSGKFNCICISDMNINEEYGFKGIYCNDKAMDYLRLTISELKDFSFDDNDCIILLPDTMSEKTKSFCIDYMKDTFESVENYTPKNEKIKVISYKPKNKILCIQNSGKFDYLSEPAVCIASDTKAKYNIDTNYGTYVENMLFETDNIDTIKEYFKGTSLKVIGYNAYEKYLDDVHFYIALIVSSIILLLLMLLYYVLITGLLIRFEYELNAKELALKKVLGYSIFRKNKNIFLQSTVVIGIIAVAGLAISLITGAFSCLTVIGICCVLFVFDILLLSFNIKITEKKRLVAILKGGAL